MDNTESKYITNFETSVTQIGTLGAAYKPPQTIAELLSLQTLLANILTARTAFQQKEAVEEDKRNAREMLYKRVAPYASELVNYCKSLGIDPNELKNLYSFTREIQGRPATPKPQPVEGEAEPPKTISSAQTSYASVAEHFANLVEAVRTLENFNPTEDKFKLSTLDAFVESLRQANTEVINADAETATARLALDELLYTGSNSVIKSMNAAKPYIRAVFGADNAVYKTITKFRFNLPKRLK